ncbi:MAG: glutathione peroxidase [Candidatus Hydrogenedentes bacterium]|nr:glutathione peroxidase [Candidatus Hydrogenedentota bacterium]
MKRVSLILTACVALVLAGFVHAEDKAPSGPLDFTVKDIDGKDVELAKKYEGKVCLIVNVASKCGNTPQYEQLEAIHKKYQEQGLAVIGFPANNFGGQEPGSNDEIKEFCTSTYGVSFDMYSKVSVKGDDQAPIYKYLTSEETNGDHGGEIEWNFAKFLVGKDGKVVARFAPKVKPDAPEVVKAIEDALAAEDAGDEWDDLDVGNLSGQAIL